MRFYAMNRRLILRQFTLLTLIIALGCSSTRYIYRDASSGIVAIPRSSQRREADELMQQHFPDGYVIERENEVITGSYADYSSSTEDDGSRSEAATTAENTTEYLIFYRSQSAPAIDEKASFLGKQEWDRNYYGRVGQFQDVLDELEND